MAPGKLACALEFHGPLLELTIQVHTLPVSSKYYSVYFEFFEGPMPKSPRAALEWLAMFSFLGPSALLGAKNFYVLCFGLLRSSQISANIVQYSLKALYL